VVATITRIAGRLVISEPKTARSRRVVPLSEPMVAMLKRRRTEQLAERLRAGDQWADTGLVFTTGSPWGHGRVRPATEAVLRGAFVARAVYPTLRIQP
jgi:hypothetical protein